MTEINITSYNTKRYNKTSFFDEIGQQITYKINHDDTPAETCNDFYPIHCQQGHNQKILRLHTDGEDFSLNSISNDLATPSVQLAADCFRMGSTINQFRRLCRPRSLISLTSSENSTGSYSYISVTETEGTTEPGPSSRTELIVHEDCDNDENEDAYVCESNVNGHYRLCKARAAHDLVITDPDTLLAKKTPPAWTAPHLRFQEMINKLDDVGEFLDLDIPSKLQEKLKAPCCTLLDSRKYLSRPQSSRNPTI